MDSCIECTLVLEWSVVTETARPQPNDPYTTVNLMCPKTVTIQLIDSGLREMNVVFLSVVLNVLIDSNIRRFKKHFLILLLQLKTHTYNLTIRLSQCH